MISYYFVDVQGVSAHKVNVPVLIIIVCISAVVVLALVIILICRLRRRQKYLQGTIIDHFLSKVHIAR